MKFKPYHVSTCNAADVRLDTRNINWSNTWCLFQEAHSGDGHVGKQYNRTNTLAELVQSPEDVCGGNTYLFL